MLLAPKGHNSIKDLGNLYKFPKLSIGKNINRMTDFRNENPKLFEQYAIRDAEIALLH